MGIVERGPCAGQPPAPQGTQVDTLLANLAWTHNALVEQEADLAPMAAAYEQEKAIKTFAALDAMRWLASSDNPWRHRMDLDRVGIMGHSLGAHAALLAGNGDPEQRFDAVVSLDGFGTMAPSAQPRVPTMFQHHELDLGHPKHHRPTVKLPGHEDFQRFRSAGVPSMVVVPNASTHMDFSFLNFVPVWAAATTLGTCPDCAAAINSSRHGERVSFYYARAWMDRWLKSGDAAATAAQRLVATQFDTSADDSSIGQGRWDPVAGNQPYRIGAKKVADHLSPLFPSPVAVDGVACSDLRQGCR